MKTTKSLLLVVLSLTFITSTAIAGKSKEEKELEKEWKKKLKKLEWEDYKKLLDDKDASKKDIEDLKKTNDLLEDENGECKANSSQLKANLEQLQNELNSRPTEPVVKAPVVKNVSSSTDDFNKGVAFKVQIGAFKNLKSAATYSKDNGNFGAEDDKGVTMYTIGEFRDYSDADALRKYLVKMGVKGAWVVSYKDGKRVHIKDVIDHIKK